MSELRRRKALADALAGVVATLVSLWTFYPMDVLKTKLQAGTDDTHDANNKEDKNNNSAAPSSWLSTTSLLFRGLHLKTLHAASSSFCYFYLYSWIASWWTARHSTGGGPNKPMSPAVRLSLSAIAAMVNTFITLPLDVLASKHQASTTTTTSDDSNKNLAVSSRRKDPKAREQYASSLQYQGEDDLRLSLVEQQQEKMEQVWNQLQSTISSSSPSSPLSTQTDGVDHHEGDLFYDSCSEQQQQQQQQEPECVGSFDSNTSASHSEEDKEEEEKKSDDENSRNDAILRRGRVTVTVTTAACSSSLTATNNSKNNKLGHLKTTASTSKSSNTLDDNSLHRKCSVITKTNSTALTQSLWKGLYPSLLLCSNPSIHYTVYDMAKSHLMQSKIADVTAAATTTKTNANDKLSMTESFLLGLLAKFCATMATYPLIRAKVMLMVTSRKSMIRTLLSIYHQDGICKGWYKGCSVQLLHTVLKSALLMMVKERIATSTHRLLVPQPSPSPSHAR